MTIERLVLIWNPTTGTAASGCLVSPDLVLTARHAIFSEKESEDPSREVELITRDAANRGEHHWLRARCAWSHADYDVALLRLDGAQPEFSTFVRWGRLRREILVEHVDAFGFPQFRAQGFPGPISARASRRDESASGSLRDHGQDTDVRLRFEIQSAAPNDDQRRIAQKSRLSWWAGMSGGPVFFRDHLIAVVVTDDGVGLDHSVLEVTPIRLLVADPDFRRLVAAGLPAELTELPHSRDLASTGNAPSQPSLQPRSQRPSWSPQLPADAASPATWELQRLAPFLTHILRREHRTGEDPADLDEFVTAIMRERSPFTLRLRGAQGTGKASLLAIVYEWLRREPESAFEPIFVNVRRYSDQMAAGKSQTEIRRSIRDDFSVLVSETGTFHHPYLLLVDGLTWDNPFYAMCLDEIGVISPAKLHGLIIAVSENFEAPVLNALFDSGLSPPTLTYRLVPIDMKVSDPLPFLRDFIEFYYQLRGKQNQFRERDALALWKRMQQLTFEPLDAHLLSIIFSKLDDDRYHEKTTAVAFLEQYCREQLSPRRGDGNRGRTDPAFVYAAELAFDLINGPATTEVLQIPRRSRLTAPEMHLAAVKLVHEHPNIRDFLASWYIVSLLREANRDTHTAEVICDKDFLRVDLPESINRFVKSIQNNDDAVLEDIFATIRALQHAVNSRLRHFCFYLLGRFDRIAFRRPVTSFLRRIKEDISKDLGASSTGGRVERQALLRTIYISLIYLNDHQALSEYVGLLLSDHEIASVNRRFHQIYYGDVTPSIDAGGERYLDDGKAVWTRSREVLETRISTFLAAEHPRDSDVLFEVHLCTLMSFIQSRADELNEAIVTHFDSILAKSIQAVERPELKAYVQGFRFDLVRRQFSAWSFIVDLYAMKTTPRQGWLDRGLIPAPFAVESVADHTCMACLVAWFLLPDVLPGYSAYSKPRVVELLLVHDIAEAYIGDQVVAQMTESQVDAYKADEQEAMNYIKMRDAIQGVHWAARAFERWSEFEQHADPVERINAQVAKDIDRFENLIQVHLYAQELGPERVTRFRAALSAAMRTEYVRKLVVSFERWALAQSALGKDDWAARRKRLLGAGSDTRGPAILRGDNGGGRC